MLYEFIVRQAEIGRSASQYGHNLFRRASPFRGSRTTTATSVARLQGVSLAPGLAKCVVIKKPATKAREGITSFTKEPTTFKAKPARKLIKAQAVKAAKDALL